MSFSFQAEQWLPYPIEPVFAFFANPENLPALMPRWQKARIEQARIVPPPHSNGKAPMAGAGSRLTLSFCPFRGLPFRLRWQAEITEFVVNSHFTDRQVSGPFVFWHHTHTMRSVDRAGINITVLFDQVEYEPPMGMLGRLANRLFLRRQLNQIFAYRQARLTELLPQFVNPAVPINHQQVPKSLKNGRRTA